MLCDNSWDTDVASCLTTLLPHTTYLLHFSHQSSIQLSRKECWYQLFGMCCSNAKELTFRSAATISGLLQVDVERNGAGAVVCTCYKRWRNTSVAFCALLCFLCEVKWVDEHILEHLWKRCLQQDCFCLPFQLESSCLCYVSQHTFLRTTNWEEMRKKKGYRSQNCQNLISLF